MISGLILPPFVIPLYSSLSRLFSNDSIRMCPTVPGGECGSCRCRKLHLIHAGWMEWDRGMRLRASRVCVGETDCSAFIYPYLRTLWFFHFVSTWWHSFRKVAEWEKKDLEVEVFGWFNGTRRSFNSDFQRLFQVESDWFYWLSISLLLLFLYQILDTSYQNAII